MEGAGPRKLGRDLRRIHSRTRGHVDNCVMATWSSSLQAPQLGGNDIHVLDRMNPLDSCGIVVCPSCDHRLQLGQRVGGLVLQVAGVSQPFVAAVVVVG